MASSKHCPGCDDYFPATLEYFYSNKARNDGLDCVCRTCRLERSSAYRIQHPERKPASEKAKYAARMKWLAAMKLEAGCKDCGYRAHPSALEFDHLPGSSKVSSVTRLVGGAMDKLLAEIGKCEIVCANCHAVRTANRRLSARTPAAVPQTP